jgi:hypothetical protein
MDYQIIRYINLDGALKTFADTENFYIPTFFKCQWDAINNPDNPRSDPSEGNFIVYDNTMCIQSRRGMLISCWTYVKENEDVVEAINRIIFHIKKTDKNYLDGAFMVSTVKHFKSYLDSDVVRSEIASQLVNLRDGFIKFDNDVATFNETPGRIPASHGITKLMSNVSLPEITKITDGPIIYDTKKSELKNLSFTKFNKQNKNFTWENEYRFIIDHNLQMFIHSYLEMFWGYVGSIKKFSAELNESLKKNIIEQGCFLLSTNGIKPYLQIYAISEHSNKWIDKVKNMDIKNMISLPPELVTGCQ